MHSSMLWFGYLASLSHCHCSLSFYIRLAGQRIDTSDATSQLRDVYHGAFLDLSFSVVPGVLTVSFDGTV
jgi:hypothetical protein